MKSHFKIKKITDLKTITPETTFDESDFSFIENGQFIQLDYIENTEPIAPDPYDVYPGLYTITRTNSEMRLEPASFSKEGILEQFISTSDITKKIDMFFGKFHIYSKHNMGVPKRGILLYGPPGTGKTSIIKKVVNKYNEDSKTCIVIWPSDKYDASEVKDFIKSFRYNNIEKLILTIEDLGGVEVDKVRIKSQSSLLSLLDNQEEIFKIPVLILATTNFPENFLGNITNRPQRFDDKIHVGFPSSEARKELLRFFSNNTVAEETLQLVVDKKYQNFSPAHLKEVVIRSALYDTTIEYTLNAIAKEIQDFEKEFSKTKKLGINAHEDWD